MSFAKTLIENLLVACHRSCCLCHKHCGIKIEIHHLVPKAEGGNDREENAIALCFDCHAEVKSYNEGHPKGRKFSPDELRKHKKLWLQKCSFFTCENNDHKIAAMKKDSPTNRAEYLTEIESCWQYRPVACNDIRQSIKNSRKELFITGMGLNTVADILCDPELINSLASAKIHNHAFKIYILMLLKSNNLRLHEAGGEQLQEQIKRGFYAIQDFYSRFSKLIPNNIQRPLVTFRTYGNRTHPRHFLLKADDILYVGSYLSHLRGSHSYLLKLRPAIERGLFDLFEEEICYLKRHSISCDNLLLQKPNLFEISKDSFC